MGRDRTRLVSLPRILATDIEWMSFTNWLDDIHFLFNEWNWTLHSFLQVKFRHFRTHYLLRLKSAVVHFRNAIRWEDVPWCLLVNFIGSKYM
ncbi:hypothetical protein C5Y96_00490 [Blastopirellula marina]|uniref:Uncharacterized protein n=1 Tax=Blastopirellula marina TaxID=124 RepID=A0A2S8G9U7_9BACT|nr:hypothetical protein C5Y96_00490 [Blastopirellula marina]RCS56252.1 hypothetical protein DTL36_00490 [Bremerella cremea]